MTRDLQEALQTTRFKFNILCSSGKGARAGAPPPPPGGMPPPPPVLPDVDFSNLAVDDRSALFAEINQGENITSSQYLNTFELVLNNPRFTNIMNICTEIYLTSLKTEPYIVMFSLYFSFRT